LNTASFDGLRRRLRDEVAYRTRRLGREVRCSPFDGGAANSIRRIYVINLDRERGRWERVRRELERVQGRAGIPLLGLTRRFPAVDARDLNGHPGHDVLVPSYRLSDQLTVEGRSDLAGEIDAAGRQIAMTPQEVAIALSHIGVWRLMAANQLPFALILEDDVYFPRGFATGLANAWDAVLDLSRTAPFDILYLSYEVAGGLKTPRIGEGIVAKPTSGLWQLSGYVLSLRGAERVLNLLPVRGPVDLWLNLQFAALEIWMTRRPLVQQRVGIPSSNCYSVMPILSQVGLVTRDDQQVLDRRPTPSPVLVFGPQGSGLSAFASALLVLGYRCCSDLTVLPSDEKTSLLRGESQRSFDAYVNVGGLGVAELARIAERHRGSRFVFLNPHGHRSSGQLAPQRSPRSRRDPALDALVDWAEANVPGRVLLIPETHEDRWQLITDFLACPYPSFPYPSRPDLGRRPVTQATAVSLRGQERKFDRSPWIQRRGKRSGIRVIARPRFADESLNADFVLEPSLDSPDLLLRDDTFPSNLALFRPANVAIEPGAGAVLTIRQENTAVRALSSGAIASRESFLYGRFEAEIRTSGAPGLVTGLFLHRNGPRQEIDLEFVGMRPSQALVNVYFNPGNEGTRLEAGNRGTPAVLELGFNASEAFHRYAIEWSEGAIRWYVDGRLVCERVIWDPTPIPDRPLQLNVNLWASRSTEFAGRLDFSRLPSRAYVRALRVRTTQTLVDN
jgi:GR25 family glycosyltransferase involved in LPS biosynthesis